VIRLAIRAGVLVRSALRGLQGSPVTSAVSIATIAMALLLVGVFALLVGNMRGLVEDFAEQIQVTAYLESDLPLAEQQEIARRVETVEGVARVALVTREQALERFRESLGGDQWLEGLGENPLPPSLEIELLPEHRDGRGVARLLGAIDGLPGVDDLDHGQDWVEGYSRAVSLIGSIGVALALVLGLAALLIVANTIRLAVYSRQDEIEILSLVGASRSFVRVPFVIEGTLQGVAGGVLALAALYVGFLFVLPELRYGLEFFLGHLQPTFLGPREMLQLVGGGALLGMLGSATAVASWR